MITLHIARHPARPINALDAPSTESVVAALSTAYPLTVWTEDRATDGTLRGWTGGRVAYAYVPGTVAIFYVRGSATPLAEAVR